MTFRSKLPETWHSQVELFPAWIARLCLTESSCRYPVCYLKRTLQTFFGSAETEKEQIPLIYNEIRRPATYTEIESHFFDKCRKVRTSPRPGSPKRKCNNGILEGSRLWRPTNKRRSLVPRCFANPPIEVLVQLIGVPVVRFALQLMTPNLKKEKKKNLRRQSVRISNTSFLIFGACSCSPVPSKTPSSVSFLTLRLHSFQPWS